MKNLIKLLLLTSFILPGCKKEDVSKGFSEKVQNVIPEKTIAEIEALGVININEGKKPPSLDGYFTPSPYELVAKKNSNNQIGQKFRDYVYKFSGYNSETETINVSYKEVGSSTIIGQGQGGVLSGSGNKFTLFAKTTGTGGINYYEIFTGEITPNGIKNWVDGIFNVNEETNEITFYHILKDSDAFTEKVNNQSFRVKVKENDLSNKPHRTLR